MNLVIYGAQGVALGLYNAIRILYPEKSVECFLVTSIDNNASTLGGLPVRELYQYIEGKSQREKDNIAVLIGTPESVMEDIEKSLNKVGLHNCVRVDSIKWGHLQELAFAKKSEFVPLNTFPVGCNQASILIYKMVHHKDKALKSDFKDPDFFYPLQVGAALTGERVVKLTDNCGDNISERNGNYSELTGLYWIWKNEILGGKMSEKSYVGLAHYRRFFDLKTDQIMRLFENDIDVVLPYPMPYEPNIEAHHERYLTGSEWYAVLQALEELQPEYAEVFKDILKKQYFYNYNIILAKRDVLEQYCSWLFPLLFRVEEINDPKGIKSPNRYIGYVGETLETLYFMSNKDKLRIAHTGCRFLV